jgi:hypothetical protein
MGELSLGTLDQSTFGIEAGLEGLCLTLALRGSGDLEAIEPLGDYLEKASGEARRLGIERVVFDFRELAFMNSSCFKAFVTFIERSKEAKTLNIVFRTDPRHHWQRRSLEALRRLAMGLVTIES